MDNEIVLTGSGEPGSPVACADFICSGHVVWNDVAGELVLFDSRDGSYHALNMTGSAVWRKIAHGRALPLIITELCNEYQLDELTISEDVHRFLADALALGLIARAEQL